jgi:glycine/D-amino acid oxidase-like deaminating enzyme
MPDYTPFLGEAPAAGDWTPLLHPGFRFGYIHQAARVNFPVLLQTYRNHLNDLGQFLPQTIQVSELDDWLKLYDRVVFCEGYRAAENTLFPGLRWQLAKGEALHIRFREHRTDHIVDMVKKTSLIAPLGNGLFWAGGSYQWHYPDLAPSDGERHYILQRLHEMLAAPFDIVDHVAGVRPSVKDRRPFLGESPVKKRVYLFNGLGTKGALLAPYWATRMAAHLLEGVPLDPEVTLQRQ